MLEGATKYLGQSYIGCNSSDKGQCVGLFNKVILDVSGVLYPITGAQGAKDLLTANNTRPDLFQQIPNNPNDPNQLPEVNDWVIWGTTWGGGYGHVACAKTVDRNGFISIEQNYVPNKVTEQSHNYKGVIGWVRYIKEQGGVTMTDDTARQIAFHYLGRDGHDGKPNGLAQPQPDLQGQPLTNQKLSDVFLSQESRNWRDSALPALYNERDTLRVTNQQQADAIAEKDKQISDLQKQVKDLEGQLLINNCPDVTINLNFFGIILLFMIKALGYNKNKEK